MTLLSVLLWLPALAIRAALVLLGLVVVPLTGRNNPIYGNNEHPVAPEWFMGKYPEFLRDYVWRAIRNPTNNMRYLISQPATYSVSGDASPDDVVRSGEKVSARRFIRSGLFSEFWYLRRVGNDYFEFRMGWKFSGVPGFGFTSQIRLGG